MAATGDVAITTAPVGEQQLPEQTAEGAPVVEDVSEIANVSEEPNIALAVLDDAATAAAPAGVESEKLPGETVSVQGDEEAVVEESTPAVDGAPVIEVPSFTEEAVPEVVTPAEEDRSPETENGIDAVAADLPISVEVPLVEETHASTEELLAEEAGAVPSESAEDVAGPIQVMVSLINLTVKNAITNVRDRLKAWTFQRQTIFHLKHKFLLRLKNPSRLLSLLNI